MNRFFGSISPYSKKLSKEELKVLAHTIETNWNLKEACWMPAHYEDGGPIIKKNIAILINENSASCSEFFTLAVMDHYPNRVKVLGKKSAGALLGSYPSYSLSSYPGVSLQYPVEDIIGINGTRVEGVGITPDFISDNEEVVMAEAIKWVTQELN